MKNYKFVKYLGNYKFFNYYFIEITKMLNFIFLII